MTKLDITAELEAARSEQDAEPHELTIFGETFTLPGGPMPVAATLELAEFARASQSEDPAEQAGSALGLAGALRVIFGSVQYNKLMGLGLSTEQFVIVANHVTSLYTGIPVGEAPGSAGNSRTTGGRPKQTSKPTMVSTSAEPSSDAS